ncbi:hypothetical protein V4T56_004180 [Vibrio vulnificus]|nr:hypothetical protein [Vibrio vulnificus]EIZ1354355.1 hypothetical protein [Vibrio vulnificus]
MESIYSSEFNDFCRKYFIKGGQQPTKMDVMPFMKRYEDLKSSLFEQFMLYDKNVFKVYGENIPLSILINELSLKGVEQLVEQDAINFALWSPMVANSVSNIDGLVPLMSGRHSSEVHTDPEQSIHCSFNFMRSPPNKKQRETITRKIRDCYTIPKVGLENDVVQMTLSAYESNKFAKFGLDSENSDIYKLSTQQKNLLTKCASDLLEFKFILSENLVSNSSNRPFCHLFNDSAFRVSQINRNNITSHIATLEQFPDLQSLRMELNLPLNKVCKLRNTKNAIKYREWLSSLNTINSMEDVTKEYIDAIANRKGFFETKKGRFVKNVGMTAIGAGIGSIAGPAGAVAGGAIGKLIEPVADFALDIIDEYFLSELTKGWSPKMFFEALNTEKNKT